MISKLIAFLQWIESSESPKKWFDNFFSFAFTVSSISVFHEIFGYEIFRKVISLINNGLILDSGGLSILAFIVYMSIPAMYLYGIYKKLTQKNFSIVQIIMNGILPLSVGLFLIVSLMAEVSYLSWPIQLFGGLYAFSPVILFISECKKINNGITKTITTTYKKFIVTLLIGFAIFIALWLFGKGISGLEYASINEIVLVAFVFICGYSFAVWFTLTYAWMEIEETISEVAWKNILRTGVAIAFVFIVIWISPDWKQTYIDSRIDSARAILSENGETKTGLTEASNIWFLEWALKERYLAGRSYNGEKELYAKLYDTSIESSIDEKVDADKYKTRNSNATSMLAKGENAKVELNFAKHESQVLTDIRAVKTVITYEFQNTATTNQEVVFSVVLPNVESTITDLKLGLNLEYTGIIAPRGAAAKVYQDSLRRNTDPALLEQTGPTSYRLRVFPILSLQDTKTGGRQRVQFTYISPLEDDNIVTLIPQTDILNLKLNKKSEILTRVTDGDTVLEQNSESGDDMQRLSGGKSKKFTLTPGKSYQNYCNINTYPTVDMKQFTRMEKKLTKNMVFFDVSKSVGEKSNIKKQYKSLVDAWKNNGISLDIFTYNFEIYPSGYTLDSLEFWGITDMSKIIDYIDQNHISDANIVIVTDDNSYEQARSEIKSIDYKKLRSNRISLIQIREGVRTLKTEITKSILATDGSMIIIDEKTPLSESVKNIFKTRKSIEVCEKYLGPSSSILGSIQGYSDSRKIFDEVGSEEIAKTAHIINQSVSLIALESDRQRSDLEQYSQNSDKYDTNYENFSNENNSPRAGRITFGSMPKGSIQGSSSSRGNIEFGGQRMDAKIDSTSNDSLGFWSEGRNNGGILQYIIVIIGFPIIAWFVLRRKQKMK